MKRLSIIVYCLVALLLVSCQHNPSKYQSEIEDAVRFLNEMGNAKPASYDEKKRVREAYEMLKNIATFRL